MSQLRLQTSPKSLNSARSGFFLGLLCILLSIFAVIRAFGSPVAAAATRYTTIPYGQLIEPADHRYPGELDALMRPGDALWCGWDSCSTLVDMNTRNPMRFADYGYYWIVTHGLSDVPANPHLDAAPPVVCAVKLADGTFKSTNSYAPPGPCLIARPLHIASPGRVMTAGHKVVGAPGDDHKPPSLRPYVAEWVRRDSQLPLQQPQLPLRSCVTAYRGRILSRCTHALVPIATSPQ